MHKRRLFLAALVHMDGTHLASNLAATLPNCVELEQREGSEVFLLELTMLTVLSHGLYGEWLFC